MLSPHSQNSDTVPLNQPSGPPLVITNQKCKHFLLDTQNNVTLYGISSFPITIFTSEA